MNQRRGWALRHRRLGLLGRFGLQNDQPAPACLQGYRTAVFATRKEARKFLRSRKRQEAMRTDGWRYWLDTTVVPVTVRVQQVAKLREQG